MHTCVIVSAKVCAGMYNEVAQLLADESCGVLWKKLENIVAFFNITSILLSLVNVV